MKNIISKAAIACALAAASFAANATAYNYSFNVTGYNGLSAVVSGSFDADAVSTDSNLLTNISSILGSVNLAGTSYDLNAGNNLDNFILTGGTAGGVGQAIVSIDGTANNFLFNGVNGDSISFNSAYPYAIATYNNVQYFGSVSNWKVTAAVPEPATYAMLLGGMGLLAGAARRRHTGGRA